MNKQQLQEAEEKLQDMKNEEMLRVQQLREGLKISQSDNLGELSLYDNHPADIGDATFEREKDLGLILNTEDKIAKIDNALIAMQEGKYGVCEECGKKISEERLQVIPYTTLCKDCKKEDEILEKESYPVEGETTFGGIRDNNDGVKNNQFDGEDAWQAVARYGTSSSPFDAGSTVGYDE
ncbi:MAG: TraR/DksA C4-type zinc finger protein [Clostridia bacterium]|nr:TraR/DksA C4-type zinc finger protein [Clostridia bacterium]MDD4048519.1 TraR/DksA C4-type zinc finger protein [Clostridia bacterium]